MARRCAEVHMCTYTHTRARTHTEREMFIFVSHTRRVARGVRFIFFFFFFLIFYISEKTAGCSVTKPADESFALSLDRMTVAVKRNRQ